MRARWIMGAVGGLILIACKPGGDVPSVPPKVPEIVQQMMAVEFPADGQVHVRSEGEFSIKGDTPLCIFQDDGRIYGMLFAEYASQIVNGASSISSSGDYWNSDAECKARNAIFLQSARLPNRDDEPYKLSRAVWQGEPAAGGAYWVGGVERVNGDFPVKGRAFHPGDNLESFGEDRRTKTMEFDMDRLSSTFIEHLEVEAM